MKILHTECSPHWGGQEYRTVLEIAWLNQNGHQAWLACDPKSAIIPHAEELNIPVVKTSMRNSADFKGLSTLIHFCISEKIDVIHTHGNKDSWICSPLHFWGFPVVRSRHITTPLRRRFGSGWIYHYGCDRIIATASCIKTTLISTYGLAPQKIVVIGEGVDLQEYHPK